MIVLLEGFPISTEELWRSVRAIIGFLVTPWPKPFSPRLLSLAVRPALGTVLGVPNYHLRMNEANVFLGTFNAADIFLYPSTDLYLDIILSRSSTDNSFDLVAWFLLWHAQSTVGPYIDRFFQIMSNQFNLPQVDSNQVVETSHGWSIETGCTWAQFQVS
jgi:hypothetical protein